ncbi:MAG: putative ABC transporter permease [Eubacteriales bacterium]
MVVDMMLFFAIYSFLGWVLETAFVSIIHRKFINRGFLIGPFTPIYGFGGILTVSYFNWSPFSIDDKSLLLIMNLIVSILLVTILDKVHIIV